MFQLDRVVPWGRSYDEYVRMFAITDADLRGNILGCGDGPAAFNAEATVRGAHILSVDPIYRLRADVIRQRIAETYEQVLQQTRENQHQFVWDAIPDIATLGRVRMESMTTFLTDFETPTASHRYVDAELPHLPFADKTFDLALCSHLLFLYSRQLDLEFHQASLRELCRVANEVRVFPLLALDGSTSWHLQSCCDALVAQCCSVTIERVAYEFQRGGHSMLRICRRRVVSNPPADEFPG